MIKAALTQILERGMNQVLTLGTSDSAIFKKHLGKIIHFQLTDLGQSLYIKIGNGKFYFYTLYDEASDVTLRGALLNFIKQIQPHPDFSGLTVEGDVDLANDFNLWVKNYEVDWEEYLSFIIGDAFAHRIYSMQQRLWNKINTSRKQLIENTRDYIQEELRFLPTAEEVEDFYHEINLLRHDIDRLNYRMSRLMDKEK